MALGKTVKKFVFKLPKIFGFHKKIFGWVLLLTQICKCIYNVVESCAASTRIEFGNSETLVEV